MPGKFKVWKNLPIRFNFRVYSNPSQVPAVSAPSSLVATASGASVILTWTDTSSGTAQTVIQRSPNGSTGWATIDTKGENIVTHTDMPATGGTYYYRTYAVIRGTQSVDPSNTANATVATSVPEPTSLDAVVSGTTMQLSWVDNTGGAGTTRIERSTTGASSGFATLVTKSAGVTTHNDTSLVNGTYWYRAIAIVGGDESIASNVDSGVISSGSSPLFTTDLASDFDGLPYFNQDRYTLVTNNPPPGKTHSARMNLKNGVTDPITGQSFASSSNINTASFVHNVNVKDYTSVTFLMRFRFDAFNWGGYAADSLKMDAKLCYIGHKGASSEQGFYLSGGGTPGMGGASGNLNWGDNWQSGAPWDGWETTSYGWRNSGNNPTFATSGSTGQSWGTDGQWHILKIQFMFNYTDAYGTYTRARALIDSVPAGGNIRNYDADGWTRLPSEFTPDIVRTVYANATGSTSVNLSTDGTETAAGLQIGDCEVWEGIV